MKSSGTRDVRNVPGEHPWAEGGRHSLRLPDWGPYTKKYIGISHIPDEQAGVRFDLSVFPGFYRRRVDVPNVMWESGYHPWEAAANLDYYSYRHELEWKDRIYCDISYSRINARARLVRCACVNQTERPQSLVLHYMASLHFPSPTTNCDETIRPCRACVPANGVWVRAIDYRDLRFARPRPTDNLTFDGLLRGEVCGHGFTGPSGIGCGFGGDAGDQLEYDVSIPTALTDATIVLRYRLEQTGANELVLSGDGAGRLACTRTGDFQTVACPIGPLAAGSHRLALTARGGAPVCLDGFAIVPGDAVDQLTFEPVVYEPRPRLLAGPHPHSLVLKYAHTEHDYGLAWTSASFCIREFHDRSLDRILRHYVHNHGLTYFAGDRQGHYTNVFFRPISLPPRGSLTLDGLVCQGTPAEVVEYLRDSETTLAGAARLDTAARRHVADPEPLPAGQPYRFSQRLMAATTLSGLVYPVYTQRAYIKHYPPGRWWDSLYTWDSGFIGLGLAEHDLERAFDCLKAYVTDVGNPSAAFIHHGSLVPVQMYLFQELWNRTQSRPWLEYLYPRLRQYYLFMAGRLGSSTMANLQSGLLRPWDYFYNSGGWDDYPAQAHVHAHKLTASVTPVSNTAHVTRSARILRQVALALGLSADVADYDCDIQRFTQALQAHAWDETAGYFSYVVHDAAGHPTGILRHSSGANFNMGLDGTTPLVAGVCTPVQEQRLVAQLMTPGKLWSPIGITAVDQSAPYYRPDGYWNGTVWMPHQWFIWKTMLDLGQAEFAFRIARCGLDLWKRETEESYNCYEHFIIATGRGAGWHQFSGLSAPVMNWFGAYYRPGRFTVGLDVWVERQQLAADHTWFEAGLALHGADRQSPCVIVCLAPGRRYTCTWHSATAGQTAAPIAAQELLPGCLSVTLPAGRTRGTLRVAAITVADLVRAP